MTNGESRDQIIVAEDSAPNRKILAHLLKKLGYEVIPCENGEEAWAALDADNGNRVVAVLSDVMMPLMDGLTLLKKIRNSEKSKAIPVVLITAVSDQNLIDEATALNVSGYILKPITFAQVESKISKLFPDKFSKKLTA